MASALPTRIGRYEIVRIAGQSNDIVYEAWDPVLQRRVAVKAMNLVLPASGDVSDRVERFRREMVATAALDHPNIASIHDAGIDGTTPFLVLDFIDSPTLEEVVRTTGPIGDDRAITIIESLLCGLEYAHKHGIVHRDVKPSNIFLLNGDTVKLTDFGIAHSRFVETLTVPGTALGTVNYMAPEQINGETPECSWDCWAAGVVLYEISTGRKHFEGPTLMAVIKSISVDPIDHSVVSNRIARELLERSVVRDPTKRFEDASAMLRCLRNGKGAPPIISTSAIVPASQGNPQASPAVIIPPPQIPAPSVNPATRPQSGNGSGCLGGMAIGAFIGLFFGGAGAIPGAIIGACIGSTIGSSDRSAGDAVDGLGGCLLKSVFDFFGSILTSLLGCGCLLAIIVIIGVLVASVQH